MNAHGRSGPLSASSNAVRAGLISDICRIVYDKWRNRQHRVACCGFARREDEALNDEVVTSGDNLRTLRHNEGWGFDTVLSIR